MARLTPQRSPARGVASIGQGAVGSSGSAEAVAPAKGRVGRRCWMKAPMAGRRGQPQCCPPDSGPGFSLRVKVRRRAPVARFADVVVLVALVSLYGAGCMHADAAAPRRRSTSAVALASARTIGSSDAAADAMPPATWPPGSSSQADAAVHALTQVPPTTPFPPIIAAPPEPQELGFHLTIGYRGGYAGREGISLEAFGDGTVQWECADGLRNTKIERKVLRELSTLLANSGMFAVRGGDARSWILQSSCFDELVTTLSVIAGGLQGVAVQMHCPATPAARQESGRADRLLGLVLRQLGPGPC